MWTGPEPLHLRLRDPVSAVAVEAESQGESSEEFPELFLHQLQSEHLHRQRVRHLYRRSARPRPLVK